jgi:hypothetical protein
MRVQGRERRGDVVAVMVTATVAVLGMAGILLNGSGSGGGSQVNGNARMITAAAVSRAGATETPSEPPAGHAASRSP